MYRFQGLAAAAVLLISSGASSATGGSDLSAVAASIVDRCYTVWTTVSDADLVRLEETLRRELRAQAAAVEARAESAEAEIALLEGRLALLNAGLGESVADAAALKTVGTPSQSAGALGREIVAKDTADTAAEIAAVEAELAEAQARLAAASLQQLRMPAHESGLSRCVDDHRARMASAGPVTTSLAVPAPAPAPAPAATPPAVIPPPELPQATELGAAPQGWAGTLTGWYEGECAARGTAPYDFRQPLQFSIDQAGAIEGRAWWGSLPQRAGDPVTETTARNVAGLVDAAGKMTVATAWKGTLAFEGQLEGDNDGDPRALGTVVWERPFELCRGTWWAN
jgi:hypothetical protein